MPGMPQPLLFGHSSSGLGALPAGRNDREPPCRPAASTSPAAAGCLPDKWAAWSTPTWTHHSQKHCVLLSALIDNGSPPFLVLKHRMSRSLHIKCPKSKFKSWPGKRLLSCSTSMPPLASTQPFRHSLYMIRAESVKTNPEHTVNMAYWVIWLRAQRLPNFCSETFVKNSAQAKKWHFFTSRQRPQIMQAASCIPTNACWTIKCIWSEKSGICTL